MTEDPIEVSAQRVAADLEENSVPFLILDIRETFELGSGVIPGAVTLPMSQLAERIEELPRERPIVCYCAHGVRSYDVAAWLQQQGYEARSMAGGFTEWKGPVSNWQPPGN